jgi:flagellar biosynthesis protein FlhF
MSFRRYIAGTVREAMDRVRRELGEDAVILSNKRLGPGRVEIVAAASDSMEALVEQADRPPASARAPARTREREDEKPMGSTESFQEFLRRKAAAPATRPREASAAMPAPVPSAATRARPVAPAPARTEAVAPRDAVAMYHEVARAHPEMESAERAEPPRIAATRPARVPATEQSLIPPAEVMAPAAATAPGPAPAVFRRRETSEAARPTRVPPAASAIATARPVTPTTAPATLQSAPRAMPPAPPPELGAVEPAIPAPKPRPATMASAELPAPSPAATPAVDTQVMTELRSLRTALSDRIAALETNIASNKGTAGAASGAPEAPRNPATTRVMTRLLMSGFSPDLARRIAAHAPSTRDIAATDTWLHQVIAGNLRCASAAEGIMESQGAVALVGPTGVGKTTTVAKLAARFAVRYGAAQMGLVTLDSYRIGAHDQLRSYSRILGVPMHIAQDGATLRELLASLHAKRLVLIDTCGLSQRDERMQEMLGILRSARFGSSPVKPVLLLNAASHAETLDEVARAWHAQDAAGAILTKLDEAARIGGAVDCLLRYRLNLFGLTNGQRVPEDWHPAGASLIAHVALKPSTSPFALAEDEAQAWSQQPQGSVHA